MAVFKTLTDEIIADEVADKQARFRAQAARAGGPRLSRARTQTANAVAWMREMIEYNVPHGKLNRGLAVLDGAPRAQHARRKQRSAADGCVPGAAQACVRCRAPPRARSRSSWP